MTSVPPPLMEFLQLSLITDGGPSGFVGSFALNIDGQWLVIRCGDRVECQIQEERPRADAMMRMSAEQADAILHERRVPDASSIEFEGDKRIVDRFVDRYLSRQTQLGLRVGGR